MSDLMLVECCAPTLAGLKTGSLFACPYTDREELKAQIRSCNRCLHAAGLALIALRWTERQALLYLFRPKALQRDLLGQDAGEILARAGYESRDCVACLLHLMRRLRSKGDFPHEIGLFLSYPPEDVKGFIENSAKNYKCIGTWKVYGDEAGARKTFSKYKKCTDSYCRRVEAGTPLHALAVAI